MYNILSKKIISTANQQKKWKKSEFPQKFRPLPGIFHFSR